MEPRQDEARTRSNRVGGGLAAPWTQLDG